MSGGAALKLEHPERRPKTSQADGFGLGLELGPPVTLEQAKALHVQTVLGELGGNLTEAARVLAVHRRSLYRMIERWGIER